MGILSGERAGGIELTPQQDDAILALLACKTVQMAAKAAKVPVSTLYGWLKSNVAFKREYRQARRVVLEHGLTDLGGLVKDSVAALKRNLKCGVPATEVKAAVAILDKAISGQAMVDMQEEIEELRHELERLNAEPRETEVEPGAVAGGSVAPGVEGDPAALPAAGPDGGVPEGGADAGPVAGGVPRGPEQASPDVVLSPRREVGGLGGEDAPPLFE